MPGIAANPDRPVGAARAAGVLRPGLPVLCAVACALVALLAGVLAPAAVQAGSLQVRVVDARTLTPLAGAFVQVGDVPGTPFESNWGWTDAKGSIRFTDPRLTGPQTVTAGVPGYALLTVVGSVVDSISIGLHPSVRDAVLPPPRARISGTVNGISTRDNDGNLDVGIVYPAVRLSDLLSQRGLSFEVPSDTLDLPGLPGTVLPGNLVLPQQTEYRFAVFSKPDYHLYVPGFQAGDFLVLAGRVPITALAHPGLPLKNILTMRQVGAERGIAIGRDRTLNLESDLELSVRGLTVRIPEAPAGSDVFATTIADLPGQGRSVFFDARSALRDTLTSLRLSGLNPSGELSDVEPYLAASYGDSSAADAWQTGRVDRTPLILPSTRTVGGFYRLPDLVQIGDTYEWSDVTRPGVTPDPSWAVASFRLDPISPGNRAVTPSTLWEAWVPASRQSLRLPVLAPGAPGGLPDPGRTVDADRLVWDLWIADPSGLVGSVMEDPFSSLTRWTRRTIEITPPVGAVREVGLGTLSPRALSFQLAPNPGRDARDVIWDRPLAAGQPVAWTLLDPSGRKLLSGSFAASGTFCDHRVLGDAARLPAGVYWVQIRAAGRVGTTPLVVTR